MRSVAVRLTPCPIFLPRRFATDDADRAAKLPELLRKTE
jgi:hypothetical protein